MAINGTKWDSSLWRTTEYSMYVFVAASPFSIALTQISLTVALLSWLCRRLVLGTVRFRSLSVEWGIIGYIFAELLSLVFSTHFSQNVIFLKRLLLIPIVYLFACNVSGEKLLKRLVWIFAVSVALYSFTGIISYFVNPSVRIRHIQNSMTAGGITMIGALVTAAMAAFLTAGKQRLLSLFFAILIAISLVLTSTRGSWVGFFIGLIVVGFYYQKKIIAVLPVIILAFYFLAPPEFSARIKHIFDPTWPSNAKRIFWWSVGLEIFKDYPVVGIGDVSTDRLFKVYAPPGTRELAGHLHNNFIQIAVTLGIIGLVAFVYMMVLFFRALYRARKSCQNIRGPSAAVIVSGLAAFWAFNVNGLFEWNFGDAEIITMIWFLIGLALAAPPITGRLDQNSQ